MNPWNIYISRQNTQGGDRRNVALRRERRFLNTRLPASLSYHPAIINGEQRNLAVINSDNLSQKTLCTIPGESLPHGGLVEWMNSHWLITEVDVNNEIYSKGIMRRCNYQLRWIADDDNIIERWCIVEDGTKYLTGEYGDRDYILTRGDTRISVTLPCDEYTVRLNRNNRFLIDSFESPTVLAYELTKPFKLGGTYGQDGVLCFVMQECNTEDTDNLELHIANYYDHFSRGDDSSSQTPITDESTGKRWF